MAEKKAKTAERTTQADHKHLCPSCGGNSRVTLFAGYGRKGFFMVCEKNCGYVGRAR
jgi:hypothetical protein